MPDGTREIMPFFNARSMAAATGLTSKVEDMAHFVSARFTEGERGDSRRLSSACLREIHQVRMIKTTWTHGQGINVRISRTDGNLYMDHGGDYPDTQRILPSNLILKWLLLC